VPRPPNIALATALVLPEPDADEPLLVDALQRLGALGRTAAWDDPAVEWSGFDLCVVRSTWNYHLARDAFLAWAARTAAATRIANPLPVLRWNSHKRYLRDLEAAGLPVVPTEHLERGSARTLAQVRASRGWSDVVVKPAVSAGSWRTVRSRGADDDAETHLRALLTDADAMVQPYVAAVDRRGERAIVAVDGAITHAVRKSPRFAGSDEHVDGPVPVEADERALADAALRHAGGGLLYGRVDMVRDDAGRLLLMELEVLEPSLFLGFSAQALERFARAIVRRAAA